MPVFIGLHNVRGTWDALSACSALIERDASVKSTCLGLILSIQLSAITRANPLQVLLNSVAGFVNRNLDPRYCEFSHSTVLLRSNLLP